MIGKEFEQRFHEFKQLIINKIDEYLEYLKSQGTDLGKTGQEVFDEAIIHNQNLKTSRNEAF